MYDFLMHKRIIVFLLAVISLPAFAQIYTPAARLNQQLMAIHTFHADFDQTVTSNHGRTLNHTQGEMDLARPGKFRWAVKGDAAQLIIAVNDKLWIYDADLQQVTIKHLDANHEVPALILLDNNTLTAEKDFHITASADNSTFTLIPKDKNSMFASVQLQFLGSALVSMKLYDLLGQVTRIDFSHIIVNHPLSSSVFHFTPPANTDVINE